jgi:hypothetical protein
MLKNDFIVTLSERGWCPIGMPLFSRELFQVLNEQEKGDSFEVPRYANGSERRFELC